PQALHRRSLGAVEHPGVDGGGVRRPAHKPPQFAIRIEASPDLSPVLFLRTTLLTILVGIVGAAFPAYRAMKIPPAAALRYE
ncbi:MAG: ABC transporter permease, partial [Thermosphaera sp.]